MSDALLERLASAAEGILAHIQKSPVFGLPTAAPATATKPTATNRQTSAADANKIASDSTKSAAEKKAAADKLIAEKKAVKDAADRAAASAAKAAKPTAGKRTIEQVREMIRKVAADVDKQSAKDILTDDGGGVEKVAELKPENYDKVYEACEVLLKGEGAKTPAPAEEDDDF